MKIDNFRNFRVVEVGARKCYMAEVDIRYLLFLTKTRTVFRPSNYELWSWFDTGEYTPGRLVEQLELKYRIEND